MKTLFRLLCGCLAAAIVLCLFACGSGTDGGSSAVSPTDAVQKPAVDPDVSAALRSFYQDQLPSLALHTGLKDAQDEEIVCDYSMLQKAVFADYDADDEKEIVLLYDVSEQTLERNHDVIIFLDEKDGSAFVAGSESGVYGASKDGETYILSRYKGRVCKVHFINKERYEAALIDTYDDGEWKTTLTAYRHISDHDGVRLESDTCYIDYSGGDLYAAVTGKKYYSLEKYLNFRTVNDNYNNLITALLAETMLP